MKMDTPIFRIWWKAIQFMPDIGPTIVILYGPYSTLPDKSIYKIPSVTKRALKVNKSVKIENVGNKAGILNIFTIPSITKSRNKITIS